MLSRLTSKYALGRSILILLCGFALAQPTTSRDLLKRNDIVPPVRVWEKEPHREPPRCLHRSCGNRSYDAWVDSGRETRMLSGGTYGIGQHPFDYVAFVKEHAYPKGADFGIWKTWPVTFPKLGNVGTLTWDAHPEYQNQFRVRVDLNMTFLKDAMLRVFNEILKIYEIDVKLYHPLQAGGHHIGKPVKLQAGDGHKLDIFGWPGLLVDRQGPPGTPSFTSTAYYWEFPKMHSVTGPERELIFVWNLHYTSYKGTHNGDPGRIDFGHDPHHPF